MDLFSELVAVTAVLEAAGIDYAVCGGVALAIHGAPRATKDIDVLVRAVDLVRVRDAARACGFTIEALPMTFSASGITMHRFTKIDSDGRTLMLDALLAEGTLESVWDSRTRVAFSAGSGERTLWVVSRTGLITLKLAAGRPQDIVDIQRLEESARGEHET